MENSWHLTVSSSLRDQTPLTLFSIRKTGRSNETPDLISDESMPFSLCLQSWLFVFCSFH